MKIVGYRTGNYKNAFDILSKKDGKTVILGKGLSFGDVRRRANRIAKSKGATHFIHARTTSDKLYSVY